MTMLARPVSFQYPEAHNGVCRPWKLPCQVNWSLRDQKSFSIQHCCSWMRLRTKQLNQAFRSELLSAVRDKPLVVVATTRPLRMTASTQVLFSRTKNGQLCTLLRDSGEQGRNDLRTRIHRGTTEKLKHQLGTLLRDGGDQARDTIRIRVHRGTTGDA